VTATFDRAQMIWHIIIAADTFRRVKLTSTLRLRALTLGVSAVGGLACSDSATVLTHPAEPTANGDATRFIVQTSVDLGDDRINYFTPVSSLAEGAIWDPGRALEVAGGARLYAPAFGGFFAVGSSEDLTVQRYDLATDGTLSPSGLVSFASQGVTSMDRTAAFISDTKAYYFDETGAQIIIWNPLELTITGRIDVGVIARPGLDASIIRENYPQRPGRLLTSVRWSADGERLAMETGLLVIDTDRDVVANFEVDTRCVAATEVAMMANGDVYFGTTADELAYNAQVRGSSRPGCHLRVLAGEDRFDPGYALQLSPLVEGRAACDVIPSGVDGEVLFRALDESLSPWTLDNDVVGEAEAWEYHRLNVASGEVTRESELGLGQVFTPQYRVAGDVFLGLKVSGNDATRLFQLSEGGAMIPGLAVEGVLRTIAAVRR
jgi:hypothetical protein